MRRHLAFAWIAVASCSDNDTPADANTDTEDTDGSVDPLDIDDDLDGVSENAGDCDDTNDLVHPGAVEDCGNAIDDDCDGVVDDSSAGMTTVGQLPYLDAADSPWAAAGLDVFVIEDMEDKTLPEGVTAYPLLFTSDVFGPTSIDSVDGDDGEPTDNACPGCQSMWTSSSIVFTFDPVALGALPTHAGIVLTDLAGTSATATLGGTTVCATLDAFSTEFLDDGLFLGETYEDRFVGIVSPAGMTTFSLTLGIPVEVDHLQFGW